MIDLDAIQARADKATTGPWKVWGMIVMSDPKNTSDYEDCDVIAPTSDPDRGLRTFNAEFIARARTDVPDLIAEVRALRAERDALASELNATSAFINEVRAWRRGHTSRSIIAIASTAPPVSLARHDADVWDRGFNARDRLRDGERAYNPHREETS
jgi:hypothetical protein